MSRLASSMPTLAPPPRGDELSGGVPGAVRLGLEARRRGLTGPTMRPYLALADEYQRRGLLSAGIRDQGAEVRAAETGEAGEAEESGEYPAWKSALADLGELEYSAAGAVRDFLAGPTDLEQVFTAADVRRQADAGVTPQAIARVRARRQSRGMTELTDAQIADALVQAHENPGGVIQHVPENQYTPTTNFVHGFEEGIAPVARLPGEAGQRLATHFRNQPRAQGKAGTAGRIVGNIAPSALALVQPELMPMVVAAQASSTAAQTYEQTGSVPAALGSALIEAGSEGLGLKLEAKLGAEAAGRLGRLVLRGNYGEAAKLAAGFLGVSNVEGVEEVLALTGHQLNRAVFTDQTLRESLTNIGRHAPATYLQGVIGGALLTAPAMASPQGRANFRAQAEAEKERGRTGEQEQAGVRGEGPGVENREIGGAGGTGGRRDPKKIATARQMENWWIRNHPDDPDTAQVAAQVVKDAKGGLRLVDVPTLLLQSGEQASPDTVETMSRMSLQQAADMPPVLATLREQGGLHVIDGNARLAAARQRGEPTIKAYVPANVAKQIEAGDFTSLAPPMPAAPPQQAQAVEGAVGTGGQAVEGVAGQEPLPPAPPEERENERATERGIRGGAGAQNADVGRTLTPADMTDQAGHALGRSAGVTFNGLQEVEEGRPPLLTFTDPQTQSTFLVGPGESVNNALEAQRAKFAKSTQADASKRIRDLVQAPADTSKGRNVVLYNEVNDDAARSIQQQTGINVSGYTHSIDKSAVNHILNRHGVGGETRKGQIPVTADDLAQLPDIVEHPDTIMPGGESHGLATLVYRKRVNGHTYFVEEVRKGRKNLAAVSMWKVATGATDTAGGRAVLTPEATPVEPTSKETIAPSQAQVKPPEVGETIGDEETGFEARVVEPTREQAQAAQAIERVTGKQVRFLKFSRGEVAGFVSPDVPGVLFINSARAGEGLREVMVHEAWHTIQDDHPDLAARIQAAIEPHLAQARRDYLARYARRFGPRKAATLAADGPAVDREAAAFMLGEAAKHQDVYNAFTGQKSSLLRRFLDYVAGKFRGKSKSRIYQDAIDALTQAREVIGEPQEQESGRAGEQESGQRDQGEEQASAASQPQEGQGVVTAIDPASIDFDPQRFQFKLGAGSRGVIKAIGTDFNPQLAGVIHVWRDPADGKTYVVNGHHRLDRALKSNAPSINVMYVDAANAKEARAAGALVNIAEGHGTAIDAAKFMRDSGLSPEDLAKEGVDPTRAFVIQGLALANLTPDLFNQVVQGHMTIKRGVILGGLAPEGQRAVMEALDKRKGKVSDDVLAEMVRQARLAPTGQKSIQTLFGTDTQQVNLFVKKATLASWVKKKLARRRNLFKFVSKEDRAAALEEAGAGTVNLEAATNQAQDAALVEWYFDTLAASKGPISDRLNEAARRVVAGEPVDIVRKELLRDVSSAIREIERSGKTPGDRATAPAGSPSVQAPTQEQADQADESQERGDLPAQAEAQVIADHRLGIIDDLTSEAQRVARAKAKAKTKGKVSKARINTQAIGAKYGISGEGYSTLDYMAGGIILSGIGDESETSIRQRVTQVVDGMVADAKSKDRPPTQPGLPGVGPPEAFDSGMTGAKSGELFPQQGKNQADRDLERFRAGQTPPDENTGVMFSPAAKGKPGQTAELLKQWPASPMPEPLLNARNVKEVWEAFKNRLLGRTFTTPLGQRFHVKEGHFFRLIAGTPKESGQRKGHVAKAASVTDAIAQIEKGSIDPPDIAGYDRGRARQLLLFPHVLEHPDLILREPGQRKTAYLYLRRFEGTGPLAFLGVMTDEGGNVLGLQSFHPQRITASWLARPGREVVYRGPEMVQGGSAMRNPPSSQSIGEPQGEVNTIANAPERRLVIQPNQLDAKNSVQSRGSWLDGGQPTPVVRRGSSPGHDVQVSHEPQNSGFAHADLHSRSRAGGGGH